MLKVLSLLARISSVVQFICSALIPYKRNNMNLSYKPEEDKLIVWQTMPLKRPRAQAKNVMMLHHHSSITGEQSHLKKFLPKHSIQGDPKE